MVECMGLEGLVEELYLVSVAGKPVAVSVEAVDEDAWVWGVGGVVEDLASIMYERLMGVKPERYRLPLLYLRCEPVAEDRLVVAYAARPPVATRSDVEVLRVLGDLHVDPAVFLDSLLDTLMVSGLGYLVVYGGVAELLRGLGVEPDKRPELDDVVLFVEASERVVREVVELYRFAGVEVQYPAPRSPRIEYHEMLMDAYTAALRDRDVRRLLRLNINLDTGLPSETPEHYLTKALVLRLLVDQLRREGVPRGRLHEYIGVEDMQALGAAVIPDIVLRRDGKLAVYEVETLIGGRPDPILYLLEKYLRVKRYTEADTSRVEELAIILTHPAALIAYPETHRQLLKQARETLEQAIGVKVGIYTVQVRREGKTLKEALKKIT